MLIILAYTRGQGTIHLCSSGRETPSSLERARRLVLGYVEHYNNVRLNSPIGYVTPKNMLGGHQPEIHAERKRKFEAARQ